MSMVVTMMFSADTSKGCNIGKLQYGKLEILMDGQRENYCP